MREILKTAGFVGVAVVVLSIAWLSRPAAPTTGAEDQREKRLFPDFNDPLAATSMEIVEFDKATAEVHPFTVAQVDVKKEGKPRWSIPTHQNYPADARDRVADAASGLMGLTILEVVGGGPGDHEYYGVLDPDPKKRKGTTTGVGTRVTMKDKRGRVLMSLVVGKEVPDRPGLRYVRKVGEDPVYVVKVSTDKLSSKFKNWIEKDLLKLNAWDVKQVQIRDHSVDELNMELIQRGQTTLEYDDAAETKWKLAKDEKFQEGKWVPLKMAPDEELNTEKLDAMKNALDDLEIVDVSRKPPGLSSDLKAETGFMKDQQAVQSLARNGFYVARVGNRVELFSNEGEIRCLMKDGVEYVLRFGEIAGLGSSTPDKKQGEDKGSAGTGLNRYIFVMTEFNPDTVPKPKLEPLPEAKPKPAEGGTPKGEAAPEKAPKQKDAADQPPAAKPPAEPALDKAGDKSAEEKTGGDPPEENEETPAAEPAKQKADSPSTEEEPAKQKADSPSTEEKDGNEAAEGKPEKADEAAPKKKPETTGGGKADNQSDIESNREKIKKENQRKQEEYDEKVAAGKKKVTGLNDRFADWYYVISDEVYQKIHLGHDQIVRKKEKKVEKKDGEKVAPDAGDAGTAAKKPAQPTGPVGEFQKLKHEGPGGGE